MQQPKHVKRKVDGKPTLVPVSKADAARVRNILKEAVSSTQKTVRGKPLPPASDIAARTKTDGRAPAVKIADLEAANTDLRRRLHEYETLAWKRRRQLELSQITIATLAAEIDRLGGVSGDDLPF
ncbi:hypothetical protein [Mesorhizobium muleiense]|uniref:hypothetical protein n=1 Tax=Mesorhizobium muleiense TaxID=1004279 RepID=UPI001F281D77|nr:hypothetical protein [Mesorhizobium muleiense]MCF6112354.1 hypothetical protein [Mesorhizobium muleiense]